VGTGFGPDVRPRGTRIRPIMFLLIVVKTPIRRILFVDKWFWWKRPAGEVHEPERLVVKAA
jgi:hypothetical protein